MAGKQWKQGVGVVTVTTLAVLTGCGDDDSDSRTGGPDELNVEGVELLSNGDGEGEGRDVTLLGNYEVGQSATYETQLNMDVSAAGQSLDMEMVVVEDLEVTEVTDDGFTTVSTATSIDVSSSDAMLATQTEREVGELIGVEMVTEHDEFGLPVGPPQQADGGTFPFEVPSVEVSGFPTEPVTVGAEWAQVMVIENEGLVIDLYQTSELVELDGDTYVVEAEGEAEIDDELEGAEVVGTMTRSERAEGRLDDPLAGELSTEVTMSIDVSDGNQSESVTSDVTTTVRTL